MVSTGCHSNLAAEKKELRLECACSRSPLSGDFTNFTSEDVYLLLYDQQASVVLIPFNSLLVI